MNTIQSQVGLETMTERLRREIFAYIRNKVGDPSSADDLTQDTFLRVERALAKGIEPEHFRGWIFQIARNAVIDWRNERRRFVELEGEEKIGESADPEAADSIDSGFRQGLFAYAAKVIQGMPAEDREVLMLTELDGFSREELAKHLGISLAAAKSRVVRARGKLRKAIEDCCRLTTDPYGKVIGWQKRRQIAASEERGSRRHVTARGSEESTSMSWAIAHPRNGSKPARRCCERERHRGRAEFFALPVVGSTRRRSPVGRFESSLPSLSSVKHLLFTRGARS